MTVPLQHQHLGQQDEGEGSSTKFGLCKIVRSYRLLALLNSSHHQSLHLQHSGEQSWVPFQLRQKLDKTLMSIYNSGSISEAAYWNARPHVITFDTTAFRKDNPKPQICFKAAETEARCQSRFALRYLPATWSKCRTPAAAEIEDAIWSLILPPPPMWWLTPHYSDIPLPEREGVSRG